MRLLVVSSDVPFVEGGHRVIARSLVAELRKRGIEAEAWYTPQNPFGRQLQAYLANWLTDLREDGLGRKIDGVIALRYPSYAVNHPNKVVWLNHRLREYYDLWEHLRENLSWKGRLKEGLRRLIVRRMDNYFLNKCRAVFAQSRTIQERLRRWGGIHSRLLYPPPPPRNYRCGPWERYFLYPSRLDRLKRQDLAIRALAMTKGPVLYLTGTGPELERLKRLAAELGVEARVRFLGHVDDGQLVELYSRARAVIFIPYQEDYGFVTAEALYSGRPVLTFSDSGGAAELVRDGENGFVLTPSPEALAEKMQLLWEKEELARMMGREGLRVKNWLSWDKAIDELLGALR